MSVLFLAALFFFTLSILCVLIYVKSSEGDSFFEFVAFALTSAGCALMGLLFSVAWFVAIVLSIIDNVMEKEGVQFKTDALVEKVDTTE